MVHIQKRNLKKKQNSEAVTPVCDASTDMPPPPPDSILPQSVHPGPEFHEEAAAPRVQKAAVKRHSGGGGRCLHSWPQHSCPPPGAPAQSILTRRRGLRRVSTSPGGPRPHNRCSFWRPGPLWPCIRLASFSLGVSGGQLCPSQPSPW